MGYAWELVADTTVASAVGYVDITGLNITKDDEYMLVSEFRAPTYSNGTQLFINNNVTATNYYVQALYANGATISASRYNSAHFVQSPGDGAGVSISFLKLTNSGYFVHRSNSMFSQIPASGIKIEDFAISSTFTVTNITSLRIKPDGVYNIGAGSRFQLYKCVAEKVADITVGTVTTSVDITGLNITKDSEYMLVGEFVNNSGSHSEHYFFANQNYTLSNYYMQELYATSSTVGASRWNGTNIAGNGNGGKTISFINIKLSNNGYFVYQANGTKEFYLTGFGGSNVQILQRYNTSTFTSTSITSLRLQSSVSNAIGIGSRFTLYKLK